METKITSRARTTGQRSCMACVVSALAFSSAHVAVAAEVPRPPPAPAERSAFERARDAADDAAERGQCDAFLEESQRALEALPESPDTHAERAQVMQPVGTDRVDDRSEPQLRRSIAILQLYIDDLERAYGDDAQAKPGWTPAQEYLADLRALVPAEEPTPFLPMPSVKALPKAEQAGDARGDRTSPPGRGLVIGGGVAIGVGVVLLVVGVVQGVRWKQAGARYDDLRDQNQVGRVTDDQEQAAAVEWYRRAGGTLGTTLAGVALVGVGTALVVVGTRKGKADRAEVRVAPGGVVVRF